MPSPVPVKVREVVSGPFAVTVSEEGKTVVRSRYTVSSPVAGYLNRTALRPGDPVRRGETVLGVLDGGPSGLLSPRDLAGAEARLRAAGAAMSLRKVELERARVNYELAKNSSTGSTGFFPPAVSRSRSGTLQKPGSSFSLRRSGLPNFHSPWPSLIWSRPAQR